MNKNIDIIVNDFISSSCTPTASERELIKDEYARLKGMLHGDMFQSGSYARFTAITPLNDLDIIWVMPTNIVKKLEEGLQKIDSALSDAADKLKEEYRKAGRKVKITPQSHSIMVEFLDLKGDFSIDIVPAYELNENNEFGEPLYRIPEVGLMNKRQRTIFYEMHEDSVPIDWIKTDPRGYISQASLTNKLSKNFRMATKLIKKWKVPWKNKRNFKDPEFKLKSFHIEIAIQDHFHNNSKLSTLDAAEMFLGEMDYYLTKPNFKDRAQTTGRPLRYIDQYVSDLDDGQKRKIKIAARSGVILIQKIRRASDEKEIETLLYRLLNGEEFIQAYGYNLDSSTFNDDAFFAIDGNVRKIYGFPFGFLKKSTPLQKGLTKGLKERKIDFKVTKQPKGDYVTYWKVRNTGKEALEDNALRGEICIHSTLNRPERTYYKGNHNVTCYLIEESEKKVLAYSSVPVKIV